LQQDIIHCHLTYGAAFGAAAALLLKKMRRNKKPVIIETNHAVGMPVPGFNRWLHSKMVSRFNGMILMAKDPYWDNFILKHPRITTAHIPNGITVLPPANDPVQKEKLLTVVGIPGNYKYLIGSISMLRPDRKPWLYVPLFYEIYKALGNGVHFILGGSGQEHTTIVKLVNEKGLSANFHLPGLVQEPTEIISLMDVYVSLSVGGTGGISMTEAALCNVPVVGIQMIENYQAKNDDWVWSDTDTTVVAKKIIGLLENKDERNKLKEGQNKYATAHFTSRAMYASYYSFYKQLLGPNNITAVNQVI